MFAIAVELLSGPYTATAFNDRSETEWPPHPARLFSAMTALWADADEPDPVERSALEWLETQPPPGVACSEARRRQVVTHFVPVNDATALVRNMARSYTRVADARAAMSAAQQSGDDRAIKRAQAALAKAEAAAISDGRRAGSSTGNESAGVVANALEVLPENRGKQGRTYPTVIPDDPTIWFVWPDATPSQQHREALDRVLSRVGRLGHSSTLVSCRSASSAPEPTWVADAAAQERLRVPRHGLLDRLELAHASHGGSEPRLLPAAMIGYSRRSAPAPVPASPLLGGDWIVLGLPDRPSLPAVRVLDVARATRGALLRHGEQPPPAVLSGHQPRRADDADGAVTPPLEGPHLAVVPLPNAGHRHSNGTILAVALVLPADCRDDDRAAVERAVQAWSDAEFGLAVPGLNTALRLEVLAVDRAPGGDLPWLRSDLSSRRRTTARSYWCREASRWLTVTPIALDRFPGDLRDRRPSHRERAEAEARAAISRACALAGLPGEPNVTIRLDSPLTGLPAAPSGRSGDRKAWRYPGFRTGGGTPRACVHAEIEFDEPVRGPVLIGAGRYFGYGLCLPSEEEER